MQVRRIVGDEAESGLGPETQDLADIADPTLLEDEVPQRATGHRFEFLADRNLRPLQGHRRVHGGLHPDTQADVEEVRIRGPALPHSRTTDDPVEPLRVAVDEQLTTAVLLGDVLDLVSVVIELTQVAAALASPVRPN